MFAVLTRPTHNALTVIMILDDFSKSLNLATFLNNGNYFSSVVFVKQFPVGMSYMEIMKELEK